MHQCGPVGLERSAQSFLSIEKDAAQGLQHIFSCESAPAKRRYILQMPHGRPIHLFDDANAIGKLSSAYDYISETQQEFPPVDLLIAGFICKDMSPLFQWNRAHKGNLLNGDGRSSASFMAVVRYIDQRPPVWVIMENVPQLDAAGTDDAVERESNLALVQKVLESMGCQPDLP